MLIHRNSHPTHAVPPVQATTRFKGVQENLFQPSERLDWPQRFHDLTPYQDPDYIHCMTPANRRLTMTMLDQGIQAIQAGAFEKANALFFDTNQADDWGALFRTFDIPVTPQMDIQAVAQAIRTRIEQYQFNGQKGRQVQLLQYTLTHPERRYSPDLRKSLAVSMAYAGLEEWLHYLQFLMDSPISRQFRQHFVPKHSSMRFDAESDITAFLMEQNIPLPHCHFSNHPERKRPFPNWETLLKIHPVEARIIQVPKKAESGA